MEDLIKSIDKIVEGQVFKIVISNKKNKEEKYNKININLKENKRNNIIKLKNTLINRFFMKI